MYNNGFIVKAIDGYLKDIEYHGIGDSYWPISTLYDKDYLESEDIDFLDELDHLLFIQSAKNKYLEVCNDINLVMRYVKLCTKCNIEYELLFIKSEIDYPTCMNVNQSRMVFLGYDYGEQGTSAVIERLMNPEMDIFIVNEYGLLKTMDELERLVSIRNELRSNGRGRLEHTDDLISYEVYSYQL